MTQQPIDRLWINTIVETTTGPLGQGVAVSIGMKAFDASAPRRSCGGSLGSPSKPWPMGKGAGGEREVSDAVAIGADHAGFELKERLAASLRELGCQVADMGTHSPEPVDYPDIAEDVGKALQRGGERGIVICGSGVGASVAANKLPASALGCHDTYSAHQGWNMTI
jgi:hypothetical protein